MAKVIVGNRSTVFAARSEQDRIRIRSFYCDVGGGKIVKEDIFRLGEEFYILFRYGVE